MILKWMMAVCALLMVGCAPRWPACSNHTDCRQAERCLKQSCRPKLAAQPTPPARSGPSVKQVLENACQQGNARSCYLLGRQHHQAEKRALAGPYLEKACQAGHSDACSLAGRAVPYSAFVRYGVADGLRLAAFKGVTLVKIAGPGGDRLVVALKQPLESACGCMAGYSEDLDFLGQGDLMVAGVMLKYTATPAGHRQPTATGEPPRPASKAPAGTPLPGMKVVPEEKRFLPAGRCKQTSVTAKVWLIHRGNHTAPRAVLVRGRSGAGGCTYSMERAMAQLAANLVALLKGTRNWKVQLFRDPALPPLEQGNAKLKSGRFKEALASYDRAVLAARAEKLPAASLAHAQYSRGLALAGLGRHAEGLAALREAHATKADVLYLPEMQRLKVVQGDAWRTPPPQYRKVKRKKKRRKPPWGPRLQRRVVWE